MTRLSSVFVVMMVVLSIPATVFCQAYYSEDYGPSMGYGQPYGGAPYGQSPGYSTQTPYYQQPGGQTYPPQGYGGPPTGTPGAGYGMDDPGEIDALGELVEQGIYWDSRYDDRRIRQEFEAEAAPPTEPAPVQPRVAPRPATATTLPTTIRAPRSSARETVGRGATRATTTAPPARATVRREQVQPAPKSTAPETAESESNLKWTRSPKPAMVGTDPGVRQTGPKETTVPSQIRVEPKGAPSDVKWGR